MRILVVEDEPVIALNVQASLLDAGYRPLLAYSLAEARSIVDDRLFDVALLDVSLPDGSIFDLARDLQALGKPFLFSTGSYIIGEPAFSDVAVINKPYDELELLMAVGYLGRKVSAPQKSPTAGQRANTGV